MFFYIDQFNVNSIERIEYVNNKETEKNFIYVILKDSSLFTNIKTLIIDRKNGFYSSKQYKEDFNEFSKVDLQKMNDVINTFLKLYQNNRIYASNTLYPAEYTRDNYLPFSYELGGGRFKSKY